MKWNFCPKLRRKHRISSYILFNSLSLFCLSLNGRHHVLYLSSLTRLRELHVLWHEGLFALCRHVRKIFIMQVRLSIHFFMNSIETGFFYNIHSPFILNIFVYSRSAYINGCFSHVFLILELLPEIANSKCLCTSSLI